jgi:hypothetical protein
MNVADTRVGIPKIPPVVRVCWSINFRTLSPPCERKPGSQGPANA